MTRVIEVIVLPSGETRVEAKGFLGSNCRDATRLLEAALGQVAEERLTQDFFAADLSLQVQQSHRQ